MVNRIIGEMISYFKDDVRRINHALKVYGFSSAISGIEGINKEQSEVLYISAVLHDIGIKEAEKKYNSTLGKYQESEGPLVARPILEKAEIDASIIERVCYLIGNHHSYDKIDGIDFQILVESDFLVNIFEDDIKRPSIESIRKKYFKTEGSIRLLDSMYLC